MKRMFMLTLLTTGFIYTSNAQSKKTSADQNFRICFVNGQYVACDANAPMTAAGTISYEEAPKEAPATPPVHLGKGTSRKSRMQVAYDDPNAPYQGVDSQVNDGTDKNNVRNIRYQNNAAQIPPNDGGLSNK